MQPVLWKRQHVCKSLRRSAVAELSHSCSMPTNGRQMVDECWWPVDDTLTTFEEFKERTEKSADVGDLLSLVEAGETNVIGFHIDSITLHYVWVYGNMPGICLKINAKTMWLCNVFFDFAILFVDRIWLEGDCAVQHAAQCRSSPLLRVKTSTTKWHKDHLRILICIYDISWLSPKGKAKIPFFLFSIYIIIYIYIAFIFSWAHCETSAQDAIDLLCEVEKVQT